MTSLFQDLAFSNGRPGAPGTRFRAALAAAAVVLGVVCVPAPAQAAFGLAGASATARNADGSVDLRAGSHPFAYTVSFEMNQDGEGNPEGNLRDLVVDLPAGMVGNPQALPRCSGADFEGQAPHCPGNTQVGVAKVRLAGTSDTATVPVYNLTPPLGVPASLGFSLVGANSLQEASLRPDDYGVRISDITIPTEKPIQSVTETIWGVPMEAGHDSERFCESGGLIVPPCAERSGPGSLPLAADLLHGPAADHRQGGLRAGTRRLRRPDDLLAGRRRDPGRAERLRSPAL